MMAAVLERTADVDAGEFPPFPVRRFTLDEFHRLVDQGMFDDERVELLEGWIVPKMTRNPPHDTCLVLMGRCLGPLLPSEAFLRSQMGVTLATSVLEPDLAVVRGEPRQFSSRHPCGADLLLAIEIADSSYRKDRRKIAIYAEAGVPVYWIVNLQKREIEVHSDPAPAQRQYTRTQIFREPNSVPLMIANVRAEIDIQELLPNP